MPIISAARKLDQFYTLPSVADTCLAFLHKSVPVAPFIYVEPSAGTGSFLFKLPLDNRLGFDIQSQHPEIQEVDYLSLAVPAFPLNHKIIVIGNPPFGKNSSLALKFVNKSATFADYVAFILPKTFKKHSMLAKISPHLHLLAELDLDKTSFEFENQPYSVPCVFQIWERKTNPRVLPIFKLTHPDFSFVTATTADFAIRRVGGLAGKVIEDFKSYSPASHYYIKANIDLTVCKNRFKSIVWDVRENTAGNPSISKHELVELYSKLAFPF